MAHSAPTLSDPPSAAAFSAILKQPLTSNLPGDTGIAERTNQAFARLIQQSGSQRSNHEWLLGCCCLAAIFGTLAFVFTSHLLLTAAGVVFGAATPIAIAAANRSSRQKTIAEQLPTAAEAISRNSIAGHNFESALRHAAQQTAAPLGEELQWAVSKIQMGIAPAAAVGELCQRTGVVELAMFSTAISLHQDYGGNIATMLDRFAVSVQDRLHYESHMRAATIATRLGTSLMLGLPPCIVAYYSFQDPAYLPRLLSSSIGRLSVTVAVVLQIVGAASVYRILKQNTQR